MRNSKLLARIRGGKPARITQMGAFQPAFIAYSAHFGYDAVWLDLEHQTMDNREVQALLGFCHLYDIDCLLRPATRDKAPLYRYLEDGATGLLVPHISTPDEARDLVRKVKFPPVGDRGIHGGSLEANFRLDIQNGREALVEHALRETYLIVQIETPAAVANVDAIAAVPGVDGLFLGPSDLSIRLPYAPAEQQVNLEEARAKMVAASEKHDKFWGTLTSSLDDLRQLHEQGTDLLIWGSEGRLLMQGLNQCRQELDTFMI